MNTGRYSLAQLLDNDSIDQIIVPEIQRDYVWGASNVTGLLTSITDNFSRRQKIKLEITKGGEVIDESIARYLSTEFERLVYNTRIGFIYAYYDRSDNRRFYLIDGQQRITTLFLLLLSLYARGGKERAAVFRKRYFRDRKPRFDYKVRENAHNFLCDFIDFKLEYPDGNFKALSEKYYQEYDADTTVRTVLENYEVIDSRVKEHVRHIAPLCDYVENFIEFNYFDTGLSAQGERLYLYMNSRGEALSEQENIKPVMLRRCTTHSKLEAGRIWERWQHFFWLKRDTKVADSNADAGFEGFLRLAVMLHMVVNSKKFNFGEVNVRAYVKENEKTFTFGWLEDVFAIYKRISDIYDSTEYKFIREKDWRAISRLDARDYMPLTGVFLQAFFAHKDKNYTVSDHDLFRTGMYLLSRNDNSNNTKVPDSALSRAVAFVKALHKAGIADVREQASLNTEDLSEYVLMTDTEKRCLNGPEADLWQHLCWEITADSGVSDFLEGRFDFIIELCRGGETAATGRTAYMLFKDKFYKRRDERQLRKDLLEYGPIDISTGNDTWNFKSQQQRRGLPANKDEWQKWLLKEPRARDIVGKYIYGDAPSPDNLRTALAHAVNYMESYRYLRPAHPQGLYPDIILLKKVVARDSIARDLAVHAVWNELKERLPELWIWEGVRNCMVLDFNIVDGQCIDSAERNGYAFDMLYTRHPAVPYWELELVKRGENATFTPSQIEAFRAAGWSFNEDDRKRFHRPGHIAEDHSGYDADGHLPSASMIETAIKKVKSEVLVLLAR